MLAHSKESIGLEQRASVPCSSGNERSCCKTGCLITACARYVCIEVSSEGSGRNPRLTKASKRTRVCAW